MPALIGLASAGAFDLLRQLYGWVTITDIVRDEVLSGGRLPGALELKDALGAGWDLTDRSPVIRAVWSWKGFREKASIYCSANARES